MKDCVFCLIIEGKLPCYKIYEDEYTLAFLDSANDVFGHTLVIPKLHFNNVLDCDEKYLNFVMLSVQKISNHFVKNCGFDGVDVLNANGKAAEQSVFHLHFHILPRKSGDSYKFFPTLNACEQTLDVAFSKLRLK